MTQSPSPPPEVDLLVLGAGAGGMTAALVAAVLGLDVLLVEKAAVVGGTTAISAGSVWVPGSHHSSPADDAGNARRYLEAALGDRLRAALADAFLAAGPEMVRFLEQHTAVRLRAYPYHPDYLVDLPGYGYARGGAAAAAGFDRLVGEYFALPSASREGPPGVPQGPTGVVHVVDARHPGLAADVHALSWLQAQERPVVVAASKIDKLTRAERQRAERDWTAALNVPVLPLSAVTGEGLDQLWTQISRLLSSRPSPR